MQSKEAKSMLHTQSLLSTAAFYIAKFLKQCSPIPSVIEIGHAITALAQGLIFVAMIIPLKDVLRLRVKVLASFHLQVRQHTVYFI